MVVRDGRTPRAHPPTQQHQRHFAMLQRLTSLHRSGNLYLGLGLLSGGGALRFTYLMQEDERQRVQLHNDFDKLLTAERVKAAAELDKKTADMKDHPALWMAEATNAHSSLQGHLMLRNVKPGISKLEVLEENVGPSGDPRGQTYCTCRDEDGKIGLYPSYWLKKL